MYCFEYEPFCVYCSSILMIILFSIEDNVCDLSLVFDLSHDKQSSESNVLQYSLHNDLILNDMIECVLWAL